MHPVLVQMFWYFIVFVLSWIVIGLFLRGFFFSYMRVRLSFGRKILVKVRALPSDYFRVGSIDNNFLSFKDKRNLEGKNVTQMYVIKPEDIYRWLAVSCVDVDPKVGAVLKYDYSAVTGYDSDKFSDLLVRALYKPSLNEQEKLLKVIQILQFVLLGVSILIGVFIFQIMKRLDVLVQT